MSKRKIIRIDEEKCNGCSLCIPNCPEGAIQIIDGKARLISDLFCDGLGACIGHCPEGAITIEEREAEAYDERRVMGNIVKQGENVIKAHLKHLKEHNETGYLKEAEDFLKEKGIDISLDKGPDHAAHGHQHPGGCPGSRIMDFAKDKEAGDEGPVSKRPSQLRQWPVQLMLVPPHAPYFNGADLLIAADCVPFAYADFHGDLLKGKVLLIGCPKLDDAEFYKEKITQIFKDNDIKSITCVHMEVPCCFGLVQIVKDALKLSGKDTPFDEVTIGIKGERK
ncbi:MAG: 4Fe-4S binding protein [Candidatus Omnitrophica bacterium]|nr:4Fe-4S binding protein [Candidatus Omnitrophota bacterium]